MNRLTATTVCSAAALSLLAWSGARAATVNLAAQGFEGTASDNWSYTQSGATGSIVAATDTTYSSSPAASGNFGFEQVDTDLTNGTASMTTSSLTFNTISLVGYTNAQISIRLAGLGGVDTSDYFKAFLSVDGAAFSDTPDLTVGGNANARWSYTGGAATATGPSATIFRPTAGGTRTTDGYSTLLLNLPGNATSVSLRVSATTDNSTEAYAFDDIKLTAVPEPAALGMLAVAGSALFARRRRAVA